MGEPKGGKFCNLMKMQRCFVFDTSNPSIHLAIRPSVHSSIRPSIRPSIHHPLCDVCRRVRHCARHLLTIVVPFCAHGCIHTYIHTYSLTVVQKGPRVTVRKRAVFFVGMKGYDWFLDGNIKSSSSIQPTHHPSVHSIFHLPSRRQV